MGLWKDYNGWIWIFVKEMGFKVENVFFDKVKLLLKKVEGM